MHPMLEKYASLFTRPFGVDVAMALLRIIFGALLIYHGSLKVFESFGKMAEELANRGWPLPYFQAFAATYIEFAGGVLLIVGLFTRPVALAVSVLFTIITFVFQAGDPFMKQEKPLMFLLVAALLFFTGPGRFSIDNILFRKQQTS